MGGIEGFFRGVMRKKLLVDKDIDDFAVLLVIFFLFGRTNNLFGAPTARRNCILTMGGDGSIKGLSPRGVVSVFSNGVAG